MALFYKMLNRSVYTTPIPLAPQMVPHSHNGRIGNHDTQDGTQGVPQNVIHNVTQGVTQDVPQDKELYDWIEK